MEDSRKAFRQGSRRTQKAGSLNVFKITDQKGNGAQYAANTVTTIKGND